MIKSAEKNLGITIRELAEWFDCGKTQIAKILKNKASLLSSYESKAPNTSVKTVTRTSDFSDINKALYEWFCLDCSNFFYPNGPQLMEKARQVATTLGKAHFKGTNGWLDKWKTRYGKKRFSVCGESGDVHTVTIESWKEKLPVA